VPVRSVAIDMQSIKILGTGRYVPDFVITNDDFAKFLDTSDEWIATRTGMKERHIALDEPAWYMGAIAAKNAMEAAGLNPGDIGLIIATTGTSDYYFPSLASLVQNHLGIKNAISFDIGAACSGFAVALDMARRYLAAGDIEKVLIVSSEILSQFTDYEDRATCILFADGAGACIVEAADGIYGLFQHTDASGVGGVYGKRPRRSTPFGEARQSSQHDPFPAAVLGSIMQNGREVYKFATKAMAEAVNKACEDAGVSVEELDKIFVHQANLRIIETGAKNLGVDMDKVYVNIHKYGNTSSASIPLGLDECARDGTIKRGDKLCIVAFGAGLTYLAIVFEY